MQPHHKTGGHEYLNDEEHCRGYPCGFEEPEAINLGFCLQEKGWNSTCGKFMEPPIYIKPGDVLIYHGENCDSYNAHAVIITQVGDNVKVTGRSESMIDEIYSYNTEKPLRNEVAHRLPTRLQRNHTTVQSHRPNRYGH